MSSLKTIILKLILVCVFLVSPCCVHRDRRPDQTVSVVPSPRFVLFVFSSVLFVPVFCPSWQASPHAASPHARRSRLSHPAVRGSSRRRSRINQPTVHRRWRHHPRLTLAYRPALTQCPPACRWLKLAGLPLTHARWSSLAGKANSLPQFTPPSAAHRPRRSREITPPAMGKANPPSAAASSSRGKPTRRPRFTRPAVGWGSLQPAGPCRCVVKPAGCCRYLSSQPVMVSPAGRCRIDKPAGRGRIWPDSDQGLFTVFCVFSPGGLLIPLSFPKEIFWGGGVVGLRPKRWGLGPRSRKRSHHGLPSSLDLCLFHSGGPVLCMYLCRSCGVSRVPTPLPGSTVMGGVMLELFRVCLVFPPPVSIFGSFLY